MNPFSHGRGSIHVRAVTGTALRDPFPFTFSGSLMRSRCLVLLPFYTSIQGDPAKRKGQTSKSKVTIIRPSISKAIHSTAFIERLYCAMGNDSSMPTTENDEENQHGSDEGNGGTDQKDVLLKKREEALFERLRSLEEAVAAFEKERLRSLEEAVAAFEKDPSPSDVLRLNVGGTKMAVLRETLTSIPGSKLASEFSGRLDDSIARDRDGDFFIDQPFPLFELMANYLRDRACLTSPNAPPLTSPDFKEMSTVTKAGFLRMLDHYGMILGIYPVEIQPCSGTIEVEYRDALHVNASDWATFQIVAKGHELTIKSFEVTIHKVEKARVGIVRSRIDVARKCARSIEDFHAKGVGEMENTVALDCCRSVMLLNGTIIPIDGTCKEGSTIRCEDHGQKWYIDGELVASANPFDKVAVVKLTFLSGFPAISAKGSFCVSKVEYCLD
jgi:hypothetical protein